MLLKFAVLYSKSAGCAGRVAVRSEESDDRQTHHRAKGSENNFHFDAINLRPVSFHRIAAVVLTWLVTLSVSDATASQRRALTAILAQAQPGYQRPL